MQAYIQQLLEDICAAQQPEEHDDALAQMPWETDEDRAVREMEAHFAEVERYLQEDPPHDLSYYCGLKMAQFPPEERLNDEQVAAIVDRFTQMIHSWNIDTDIPDELSPRIAYSLLTGLLDEHFHMDKWSMTTWSFCSFEPATCPYGAHCWCKDYEWVKDLPEGDEEEVGGIQRERDERRRRWDDDFLSRMHDEDLPL